MREIISPVKRHLLETGVPKDHIVEVNIEDKAAARVFFQKLRQEFIDWNYAPWESISFKEIEGRIDGMLK